MTFSKCTFVVGAFQAKAAKTALEEAVRSSAFERSAWESAWAGPAPGATAAEDGPAAG